MVMLVEESFSASDGTGSSVQDQTQTISVGQNARQSDQAAIALVIGGFGPYHPTGQQVRFRIHIVCRSPSLTPRTGFCLGADTKLRCGI